jgi:oligopeptidase A
MNNPLCQLDGLPRFDDIRPEHVAPAIDHLLAQAQAAVDHAASVQPVSWDSFVAPLDDALERLFRAWGQVSHLQAVVNAPELRAAYNEAQPKVTRFSSLLGQDLRLHAQYQALAASAEYAAYSPARQRVVENALRDFRLGGAELADADKQRFRDIQEQLAALSTRYSENLLDATDDYALFVEDEAGLAGLPADVIAACRAAAAQAGKSGYKLGLQMPVYLPVQTYADNRGLRETLYRANAVRASEAGPEKWDNTAAIGEILALRNELARLLGFADYAQLSLVPKMAPSVAEVERFLRELAAHAHPPARRERVELEAFARRELGLDTLEPWDLAYASEKQRQAEYALSALEVKPYLTESRVLAGLFGLIRDLYELDVVPDQAPTWHPDVRFYRLQDAGGQCVGQFYLDLYAREGKRGGAWMDDCRNRRESARGVQTPIVYLVCNFARGVDGQEATFNHNEVVTLFHEMGHGLHQLLTQVGDLGVAGINGVEWDAVELPSQFMENFAWEWDCLQAMTAHVDHGGALPRELYERMLAARNFQSGMFAVRQLEFALFDMAVHQLDGQGRVPEVMPVLEKIRDEVAVNRPPAWHRFPQQFSHIFAGGYAAGYYSYKWAEVLSADAYAAFEEAPAQRRDTGRRFQREVLARGGSRPAMQNFVAFRGREPQLEPLLRHTGLLADAPASAA